MATDILIEHHNRLDALVLSAYGLDEGVDVEALFAFLLKLNHERANEEARATKKRVDTIIDVLVNRRLLLKGDDGRLRPPSAA